MERLQQPSSGGMTRWGLGLLAALGVALAALQPLWGQVSSYTMSQFSTTPVNLIQSVTPMVMLAASKDHQLFTKAYDDYTDLTGDGVPETGYTHNVDYYGYFDSYKCYTYNATYAYNGTTYKRFEPVGNTSDKYCSGNLTGYWSGNFLNWGSMTRMDAIRKILFGGHRRIDASSDTVLERAYLPMDIHSFAKYYDGSDIPQLTPFSQPTEATRTSATSVAIGTGSKTFTVSGFNTTEWVINDFVRITRTDTNVLAMLGYVTAKNTGTGTVTIEVIQTYSSGTVAAWSLNNKTRAGITLCNTTYDSSATYSQSVTAAPLIRVAKGNYALWAMGEVVQCRWREEDSSNGVNYNDPSKSDLYAARAFPTQADAGLGVFDYTARVQACNTSYINQEQCKQYPSGNYKPIGLLQTYGDNDQMYFGMMAGTYSKHNSGGDLITDIGSMTREVATTTDGHFTKVYQGATVPNGVNDTSTKAEGIINAWTLFRIYGYKHGSWTYAASGSGSDSCALSVNFYGNETNACYNWGNPFSEIYLNALRYMAGEPITGQYRSGDSSLIAGLETPQSWSCPMTNTTSCAGLFVVAINTSNPSVDSDELDGASYGVEAALDSSYNSTALTNQVGVGESINGSYFVGDNGVANVSGQNICTAKNVTALGNVKGICPMAGAEQGSYRIAGIAYHAHLNDIRASGSTTLNGTQNVDTYAVQLAPGTPKLEIAVPGGATNQTVTLLPACLDESKSYMPCSLVDFKLTQAITTTGGVTTGKALMAWEDSLQGNDYDLDLGGSIYFSVTSSQIMVSTSIPFANLGYKVGHGYILSGTTQDGLHLHSGANAFTAPSGISGLKCGTCSATDPTTTAVYNLTTNTTAALLKDPLWYAAKWGSFQDSNGNNLPDLQSEWDKKSNSNGTALPDGIPDTYFFASNPAQLEESLDRTFQDILQRTSSGTAAAVVSTTAGGEGAVYQAYFEPSRQDGSGNRVTWVGTLQALWVDTFGWMREDDGNAKLDNYDTDKVIEFYFDETDFRTKVKRYTSYNGSVFSATSHTVADIDEISPLWNARIQMYYNSTTDLTTQRSYASLANSGRFIKTWIDADGDNVVDAGEFIDFTASAVNATKYGHFDLANEQSADGLINYLRGQETPTGGYRSRSVDYDSDGNTEVMRLGDIVNSSPTVVGPPKEAFDLLYSDSSYATFRERYANRRQVVYVGANDGFLHAFNGGFYDAVNQTFSLNGTIPGSNTSATTHPLGSELWAYAPMNLLPHLKWLKQTDYSHVFYVDGKPRVFDAKVFTADSDHPGGWGTVLVAGMRFGGGSMTIDASANGLGGGNATDDRTRASAYLVFDITNPENEPILKAEFQLPDRSFTTVYPTVSAFRDVSGNTTNQWYLVTGTGPNNMTTASYNATPSLYAYNLSSLTFARGFSLTGGANTFMGDPVSVDWDLDFLGDTLYFGTSGNNSSTLGGLWRLNMSETGNVTNWSNATLLLDPGRPITTTPTVALDEKGKHWVYAGSGRLYVSADKTNTVQQGLYGVRDPENGTTLSLTNLFSITSAGVLSDGNLTAPLTATGGNITTLNGLESHIANNATGWFMQLNADGTNPSEKALNPMSLLGATLFATFYTPDPNQCSAEGLSRLVGLYYKTGTAYSNPTVFGSQTVTVNGTSQEESIKSVSLGRGMATTPNLHTGAGKGEKAVTVITQMSTGSVTKEDANTIGSGVRSGEISWREYPMIK
ncbi:MAG: hypothetical protein HQL51_02170 [Magnetococcales bacterium]|nr:hypothetical protein [Magnetococcales bacterium]